MNICYQVKVISTTTKRRAAHLPERAQVVFIGVVEGFKWSFTRHLHLSRNGEYYSGVSVGSQKGLVDFPPGITEISGTEWEVSL